MTVSGFTSSGFQASYSALSLFSSMQPSIFPTLDGGHTECFLPVSSAARLSRLPHWLLLEK